MNTATHTPTPWVYWRSEPTLWTVGYWDGEEQHTDSDHDSAEKAAARVHYLNGGNPAHDELMALAQYIEKLSSSPLQRDYVQPQVVQMARAALAKAGAS